MQRLTTLLLLAGITFTAQAQTVDDYQPDSDGDGCVGLSDLLSLLSVFGSCEAEAFACGDPVNYQGYDYATVLIGEQCWFAENLRSENYENGDAILDTLSDTEWASTTAGAVAVYGEDEGCESNSPHINACDPTQSLTDFGRLYNWHSVNDSRALCPSGWHIPNDSEWETLVIFLGGDQVAGNFMKSTESWALDAPSDNSSGFGAKAAGFRRHSDGSFVSAGYSGHFWTSTSVDGPNGVFAFERYLNYGVGNVYRSGASLQKGISVRCIKDAE